MNPTFTFTSKVWLWNEGKGSWHFVTVPTDVSVHIKGLGLPRNGFGSVRVEVTIGKTKWKTSIFPEKKGTYCLPLKSEVRKKEKVAAGNTVQVGIALQV